MKQWSKDMYWQFFKILCLRTMQKTSFAVTDVKEILVLLYGDLGMNWCSVDSNEVMKW
jgi:hypothetical protein